METRLPSRREARAPPLLETRSWESSASLSRCVGCAYTSFTTRASRAERGQVPRASRSARASIPAGTSISTVSRGLTVGLDVAYYVVQECRATKLMSHRGVDTDRKAGFTPFILPWYFRLMCSAHLDAEGS